MIALLVAAFVLSGAAGLIYESIWSRYLGLFVGHSAYAQIIVLVIFLGGMSLGAHVAGRYSTRIRAPLLWYAAIEFVVGLIALWFHQIFTGVTAVAYEHILPATSGVSLVIVKWLIAGALIWPQSLLLGATFPLMSAGVIRIAKAESAPGRTLSLLYFANSLGAAAGVLVAGFYLLEDAGLPGTLLYAGFVNISVALAVAVVARAHKRFVEDAAAAAPSDAVAGAPAPSLQSPISHLPSPTRSPDWQPLLIVAFGTAVASFIYEIGWIRMLSLVHGSATHSFELMLSAFIFGLALGALWIRRRADQLADPVRFLAVVQVAMGLLAIATLPLYVASFGWVSTVIQTVRENEYGYRTFIVARYAFALLVMLPATFCAGMTLPLITRILMRGGEGERAIGAVYAVNTLGSIIGVILAGLILMPLLGLRLLLIAGAAIDIGLGVWLLWRRREQAGSPLIMSVAVATTVVVMLIAAMTRFDRLTLTSGVYRHGTLPDQTAGYSFPFYKDGRTATVSLRSGIDGFTTLATNGKPDASLEKAWTDTTRGRPLFQLTRDIATQVLLPVITLAHRPGAENAAVIGFGSGMSSHFLLGSPIMKQVVTIEIEPEMINASRGFLPANQRVYDDPRSTLVIDDAKSYFASSGRKFDLILSEPSNPWVSGVSGLFTLEFYQRIRSQLSPNGVFGQWLHLYELNDGLVTSVLAAINAVFPSYEVFFTSNGDVLVVTSNQQLPDADWRVTAFPAIAAELKKVVPMVPEQLEALRLGGRDVLRPMIMAHGEANSDYFPVLDLGGERARFMSSDAIGYMNLSAGRFDVVAALSGRRAGLGHASVSPTPDVPRPAALALGATLQAIRTLPRESVALIQQDDQTRAAVYRLDQLAMLAAGLRPPTDWHRFLEHVMQADVDLHSGTAGVVDEKFFAPLRSYAARAGAPAEARAALDFLHGIGTWNWAEAAAASTILISSKDERAWIPNDILRNGTTVAYIKLGQLDKAQETLKTFGTRTGEDAFRERIIASYLIYADTTLRAKMGWK